MESMMNDMMSPFGMFNGNRAIDSHMQQNRNQNSLMPFGFGSSLFPNMDDMFANFVSIFFFVANYTKVLQKWFRIMLVI